MNENANPLTQVKVGDTVGYVVLTNGQPVARWPFTVTKVVLARYVEGKLDSIVDLLTKEALDISKYDHIYLTDGEFFGLISEDNVLYIPEAEIAAGVSMFFSLTAEELLDLKEEEANDNASPKQLAEVNDTLPAADGDAGQTGSDGSTVDPTDRTIGVGENG